MEEIGRIIEIKDDLALIYVEPSSLCSDCGSCVGFGESTGPQHKLLAIPNTLNASKNDLVVLSINSSKAISISAFLYLFPLFMMVVFYYFGTMIQPNAVSHTGDNPIAIIMALASLIPSLLIIYLVDKFLKKKNKLNPEMVDFYTKNYVSSQSSCNI